MFELSELKNDAPILKEIPVTCLENPAKIIVELSQKVIKKERAAWLKSNHLYQGEYGTEVKTEKVKYLVEMADICVKDSQGLFAENGKEAGHDANAFKIILERYPAFLAWFGDALTVALNEFGALKKDESEHAEKN